MKITPLTPKAYEFACQSAACRPPTSGGTGGSSGGSGRSAIRQRGLAANRGRFAREVKRRAAERAEAERERNS